ncbi:MAG TPA: hypothetical protein VMV92_24490 [Streptosporangiaceae bacterium]|nr:hypothetical protein [Streptosporangiaceae bacterium]
MNPRTRQAALHAIGIIAILASINALAHSYAGLYDWATHHHLTGWQARSWPAEIDIFLAIGELALYIAYLDNWPARQRTWPWATALTGLTVSIAGNIGHLQATPGHPVILTDRLTAATSPLAAFAGLTIGLLVLKMTRHHTATTETLPSRPAVTLAAEPAAADPARSCRTCPSASPASAVLHFPGHAAEDMMRDATAICQDAAARGEQLSQRALARKLRARGHRFPNDQLRLIAASTGLTPNQAA